MAGSFEPEHPNDPVRGEGPGALDCERSDRGEPAADAIDLYKAVRAHEVMLNEATSAFEHAVITRLAGLNAGAAAAFLTLLGVLLKANGRQPLDTPFAAAAIVAWSGGLFAASIAAWYGLRQQRTTNKGYRILREGLEQYLWPDIAPFVKAPDDEDGHVSSGEEGPRAKTEQDLHKRAVLRRNLRIEALGYGETFNRMVPISAACFAVGTVFALVSVVA